MNAQHFRTFVWLRWRLFVNGMRRGGVVNAVFVTVLAAGALVLALSLFVIFFCVGLFALPTVDPSVLLYVWDGLVAAFLFFWAMGVLMELQRSEALSLDKFLHLPVSLTSAFLINYLSSLFNLTTVVFLPAMLALALALAFARGPALLAALPLLAAFFLMVTAVTYQFQGWLASLMVNPRRRRTVIVLVTAAFILLAQLPNLLNLLHVWGRPDADAVWAEYQEKRSALNNALYTGEITPDEFQKRQEAIDHDYQVRREDRDRREEQQLGDAVRVFNWALPPGWLPLGAEAAAEGRFLPALLCFLGMAGLGALSLWRSYRTTVRLYTGHFNRGGRVAVPAAATAGKPRASPLERRLPWLSEQATAVALGSFWSFLRAPEAKMMLLTPIILMLVFGSLFLAGGMTASEGLRPLMAVGAVSMVLVSMIQFAGNPFGFDRGGFRVYVLSAAPRRDVLLGKNLAFAPLALALSAALVGLLQCVRPMRLDYLLAVAPQAVLMYLLFCVVANWMAILAPMAIRPGSMRASNPKGVAFLIQLGFTFLFPLTFSLALLPLGAESLLALLGWVPGVPVCLLLSLAECAAAVFVYWLFLTWQGRVLQAREQRILEIVSAKGD